MHHVKIEEKYTAESGAVLITETQALVRVPMPRREMYRGECLNTAGFISGYRGSSPVDFISLRQVASGAE